MIELFVAYDNKMMPKKNHHTLRYHGHQTLKEKKKDSTVWNLKLEDYYKTLQGTFFEQGHLRLLCYLPVEQYVNLPLFNVG